MEEDRIAMSQRERDRLKVMAPVLVGRRAMTEAARLLGLSVRQVRRLRRRLEAEGDAGVVHRLRGRPSNRRHPEAFRHQVAEGAPVVEPYAALTIRYALTILSRPSVTSRVALRVSMTSWLWATIQA